MRRLIGLPAAICICAIFLMHTNLPAEPADGSLAWSTFLGGTHWDWGGTLALDSQGCVYVAGTTKSADLPATSGAYDEIYHGGSDAYIAKLNPAGTSVQYLTYLGNNDPSSNPPLNPTGYNEIRSIAVDSTGCVYAVGYTDTASFPTTDGTTGLGGFLAKLNVSGSNLLYSSVNSQDGITYRDIAVDEDNNVYAVFGVSYYLGFTKIDSTGACVLYTFNKACSGTPCGIAVDSSGCMYIAGYTNSQSFNPTPGSYDTTYNGGVYDAFVAKMSADGERCEYATFIGGSGEDACSSIAVDSSGCVYVTGTTDSNNFPTTPGSYDRTKSSGGKDTFVLKLSADGSQLIYSTLLGGSKDDIAGSLAVTTDGYACVAGYTASRDFPVTPDAYCSSYGGGFADGFVAKFTPSGDKLAYSTLIGGKGEDAVEDIAVDPYGNVYITGETWSDDFPTTEGAFDRTYDGGDAFVCKLSIQPKLAVSHWPASGGLTIPDGESAHTDSEVVSIVAMPLPGYVFAGWEGDVEQVNSPSTTVRMDGSKKVTALFAAPGPTIAGIRGLGEGAPVTLGGKTVTGSFASGFYIEEPDRSSGIKVVWNAPIAVGSVARVTGHVAVEGVEQVIVAESVDLGTTSSISPLFMPNRLLGGHLSANPELGFSDEPGLASLYNLGLLVRTSGRVTYCDASRDYAYVDDGSGLVDAVGSGGGSGIRVIAPAGVPMPPVGHHVILTGISSAASTESGVIRCLRLRSAEDIMLPAGGMIEGSVRSSTGQVISQTVKSSHPYPGLCNQTWTVQGAADAAAIRVHFSRIQMESGCDYLYLKNSKGEIQQTYDNDSVLYGVWSDWIDGNTVQLNLVSDDGVERYGFEVDKIETRSPGAPIAGAVVHVNGGLLSTTTDQSGRYCFPYLGPNSYTVTPAFAGYSSAPTNRVIKLTNCQYSAGNDFLVY